MRASPVNVVVLLALLTAVVVVLYLTRGEEEWHSRRCLSCVIHLSTFVFLHADVTEEFPSTQSAFEAFREMSGLDPAALEGLGCPSFPDSFGYRYVAEGLPTQLAAERDALVFFCPKGLDEDRHFHAFTAGGGRLSGKVELLEALRRALRDSESNLVPYSPPALEAIREQVALLEGEGA